MVAAQVLAGLAAAGHPVRAIAPITQADLENGDPFARRCPRVETARFVMPYLDTSPDTPPAPAYRERERSEIVKLADAALAARVPDVVVVGRESFGPAVAAWAGERHLPTVLLVAGSTTIGILNGSYPRGEAAALLEGLGRMTAVVTSGRHMEPALTGLGVARVDIIPNPVDLDRFRAGPRHGAVRRQLGVHEDQIVVMHLSNLKGLKRVLDLVDAAERALREDDRLRFTVVGEGPCRREAEECCASRGIADFFRFTGWVDHHDVPGLVNAADIVVMPSAGETQALVYLEAQACERTLIASDIPAAREVIEHDQTGLLFPMGDTGRLAAEILRAAGDPRLRARLGSAARRSVGRHSLTRVVEAYGELLARVVVEPRRAASATP